MRAAILLSTAFLFSWPISPALSAQPLSAQLAAIPGVRLFITVYGEKPCDYVAARLRSDTEFTLNTANISFANGLDPNAPRWPLLEAVADSLNAGGTCVWTVRLTLSAEVTGGNALGSSYFGYVDIWKGGSFGVSPGNGLTANVSDTMQAHLREMVNDIYESRKYFPSQ